MEESSLSELESETQAECGAATDEDEDAEGSLVEEEIYASPPVYINAGAPVAPMVVNKKKGVATEKEEIAIERKEAATEMEVVTEMDSVTEKDNDARYDQSYLGRDQSSVRCLTIYNSPTRDTTPSPKREFTLDQIIRLKQDFRDAVRDLAIQGLQSGLGYQDVINIFAGQAETILLSSDKTRI